MVNNKHVFWLAFVFTVIIFIIGLAFGVFVEQNRSNQLSNDVMKSETSLLDEQIMDSAVTRGAVSCDLAVNSTFAFADRIYSEASMLEEDETASEFTSSDLDQIHQRYDLLRMILWSEAISLKSNCNESFHTVVYFYDYNTQDPTINAEQYTFSNTLLDIKNDYPDKILLIPIAANLNLSSVNLALMNYNVTSVPSILIDQNKKIDKVESYDQLQNIIFNSNKE